MLVPPWRVGAPSYGKSCIRPCKYMLFPWRGECVLAFGDLAAVMLIQIVRD